MPWLEIDCVGAQLQVLTLIQIIIGVNKIMSASDIIMVKYFMRAINEGVYVPGVQFRDQPCNQPLAFAMQSTLKVQPCLVRSQEREGWVSLGVFQF
jgi:hypothetical protein